MFQILHELVSDVEAVTMVAEEVVSDFAKDGVVYLELRTTPRANPKCGMTKQTYVEAVLDGIQRATHHHDIQVRSVSGLVYFMLTYSQHIYKLSIALFNNPEDLSTNCNL